MIARFKNQFIFLLISGLFLTSCSFYSVNSVETTTDYFPSKKSALDVVYLEKLDKPHTVIGTITVNTERRQGLSDIIERIKVEAAILGGDAITNIQSDATGTWKRLPAQNLIGNAYVRANYSATVVAFQ